MGIVDFSRGELSPDMKYRNDLEAYYKGVETLHNFIPAPQGGLIRRPGTQILGTVDASVVPAVRTFNLGSTGLSEDISAPGEELTVTVGSAEYDTQDRVYDIEKNKEIQLLLVLSETNNIEVYWISTPNGVPAYVQTVWNYDSGHEKPTLGFDDTRDARVVQIETSVYVVALNRVYKLYWDVNKPDDTNLEWDNSTNYSVGDVVYYNTGSIWLECIVAHDSSTLEPNDTDGPIYWKVVYPPYISWQLVEARAGRKLLQGNGSDYDTYTYSANKSWADGEQYYPGDVVLVSGNYYECDESYTAASVPSPPPTASWTQLTGLTGLSDDDKIYLRHSKAYREETIPREIVAHQGRLIMSSSSLYPSTVWGSEINHYMNFGAGPSDDDPWIYTISGDRVGRILWMYVTDQLYFGTKGGVFGVSGVITPTQFLLRKVTAHTASEVEGVAVAGSLIFFQGDKKTLREVKVVDSDQNYQALDLTVFSQHLFEDHLAVKMVVQNSPYTIIWILRDDGKVVSLSYEQTVGMFAYAVHEMDGLVKDICGGTGDDVYMIIYRNSEYKIARMGTVNLKDEDYETDAQFLDGLVRYIRTDVSEEFAIYIQNDDFRDWMESNSISSVTAMRAAIGTVNASSQSISGLIKNCGIRYFEALTILNLSTNQLAGWASIPIPITITTLNLSDNNLTEDDVNLILSDLLDSVNKSNRTGTVDLSGNTAATYDEETSGLAAAAALVDAGWTVTLDNAAGWADGQDLSYDANSGTGTTPTTVALFPGESTTVSDQGSVTRDGYEFIGWNTKAGGTGDTYNEGDFITMDSDGVTLYAKWRIWYTLSYNGNGNDEGTAPSGDDYHASDLITIPSITSMDRTGYVFSGFNTASDGSGTSYSLGDTFYMPNADVTLYAQWTIQQYTISFDSQGGGAIESQTLDYGSGVTEPTSPTKEGYTFVGWYTENTYENQWDFGTDTVPDYDVTLYAKWNILTYEVTFKNGYDGTTLSTQDVIYNEYAVQPVDPTREGYEFENWFSDAECTTLWNFSTMQVTEDTTLYAGWEQLYQVTYDDNGSTSGPTPTDDTWYHVGDGVSVASTTLTKTGYRFDSWNTAADGSGTTYQEDGSFAMPEGGVTLYAQWEQLYQITYDGNSHDSGTVPVDTNWYAVGDPVTVSNDEVARTGYEFNGWSTSAEGTSPMSGGEAFAMPKGGATLYAAWDQIYTLAYDKNTGSGTVPTSIEAVAGTVITLSDQGELTKDGYQFSHWNTAADGSGSDYTAGGSFTMPVGGEMLYAQWEELYTVSYNGNGNDVGTAPSSEEDISGGTITVQSESDLDKTGYTFSHWNTASDGSGDNYSPGDTLTLGSSNVTLYAVWAVNTWTVTYDSNSGSSVSSEEVDYGDAITEPTDPTQSGYTFGGWYTDETYTTAWNFSTGTMPDNDVSLYAKWTINEYSVTFDSQGGSSVSGQVIDYGGYISEPTDPTRTGYTFQGWYLSTNYNTEWDFANDTVGTENVTLYAKWNVKSYLCTFDSNGGPTIFTDNTVTVNYGDLIPNPVYDDTYVKSVEWYSDETLTTLWDISTDTMPDNNITIYVKWDIYELGDTGPAGGIVFYDKGYESDGWRFLEICPYNTELPYTGGDNFGNLSDTGRCNWGGFGTETNITARGIGEGLANTQAIYDLFGNTEPYEGFPNYAARQAIDLTLGGYSDWFLPSIEELWEVCNARGLLDNYETQLGACSYQSSTEDDKYKNLAIAFNSGFEYEVQKLAPAAVRPIRRF